MRLDPKFPTGRIRITARILAGGLLIVSVRSAAVGSINLAIYLSLSARYIFGVSGCKLLSLLLSLHLHSIICQSLTSEPINDGSKSNRSKTRKQHCPHRPVDIDNTTSQSFFSRICRAEEFGPKPLIGLGIIY
ncbi:hypothetical protein F5Y00DRAFT_244673 [Daldinia vernicosa]|uniref:uncharacterized protein n=1 Tax=Daldinia vernicosa TaxID=114800 RepID=UPI002007735F|nr:uncharacterized protein F5Y00DRAFT_244673 [Daldinia vernicosa]KAI0846159.1 hypothetical protein F5Y00DRAFT_244673 [Daldinia vernicosa]